MAGVPGVPVVGYLSYPDLQQGTVLLGLRNMPFRSTDWQISLPRPQKGHGGCLGRDCHAART